MRIAVIGATGRTGRLVLAELVSRHHQVTALTRDAAAFTEVLDELGVASAAVIAVEGDSRDPVALRALVDGAEAVISALGPRGRESTVQSDTACALVPVLHDAGIRRFVGVSGAGLDAPADDKSRSARVISRLMRTFGGAVVADKAAELDILAASSLDWTLLRPPRLTDGPATGTVEIHAHRSTRSTSMSRADLASTLVDVVEDSSYVHQLPFVASRR